MEGQSKSEHVSVFVDVLNFVSGLRLLTFVLRNRVALVRYISTTKSGLLMLKTVGYLRPNIEIQRIDLDFSSEMPEGGGLWYWAQVVVEDVTKSMTEIICRPSSYMDRVSSRIDPARRYAFLHKSISREIYRSMILILLAHREASGQGVSHQQYVLVTVSDLFSLFQKAAASCHLAKDIRLLGIPDFRSSLPLRLLWFVREQCGILVWAVLKVRIGKIMGEQRRNNPHPHSVALRYLWGSDIDRRGNDFWWYRSSGLDNSRCVAFLFHEKKEYKTHAPAPTLAVRDNLEALGFRHSVVNHGAILGAWKAQGSLKSVVRMTSDLFALVKTLFWALRIPAARWQLVNWITVVCWLRRWQAFMETENVKVIFDYSEGSLDVVSLAADVVGAVKLGYSWGDYPVPFTGLTPIQQVQFIWGRRYRPIFKEMGIVADVILESGSTFDDGEARPERLRNARKYRTKLEESGVRRVVSVFDRACSPGSLCPPRYHVEFYDKLFSWAESDGELGLIVKPKYDTGPGAFAYDPDLEQRLNTLIDKGQAMLLLGHQHPAEAALASDMVVALALNSAGILSALEGARTVFWDPAQAHKGPSAQWLDGPTWEQERVVFGHMDTLIDSVSKFFDTPTAFPTLGDISSALDEIDGFRDGITASRTGSFVRWFLEGLDKELDRSTALARAVNQYSIEWGVGKVHQNVLNPVIDDHEIRHGDRP